LRPPVDVVAAYERWQACQKLLALPDPADLYPRGCRLTCAGDPERFMAYRDLPLVHQTHVLVDREQWSL